MAQDDSLLAVIKRQLFQSNADSEMEALLIDYMEEGKAYLNRYCADLDFEKPGRARSLLVDYIRYALSNARDDFPVNYRSELIALSNLGRTKAFAEKQSQ